MVYFPTAANLAMKDYLHWFKKKKKRGGDDFGQSSGQQRGHGSLRLSVLTLKPEIAGLTVRLSVSDADLDSNLRLSEVLAAAHTLRRRRRRMM